MRKHLNICIRIEETAALIYRQMLETSQLTDAVRETLIRLANDEDQHASQLRFALNFPEDSVVSSDQEMLKSAQGLLAQAEKVLQTIRNAELDDRQAIRASVELEQRFCKVHIGNSFKFKDQKLKEMFAAMARADEEHCQRLLELEKNLS